MESSMAGPRCQFVLPRYEARQWRQGPALKL
jgi:hypothetical protein